MTRETIAKFVDAFLADDAEECHKPEYENLAALVAMTYAESAWRTAMKRGTRSRRCKIEWVESIVESSVWPRM